MRIQHFEDHTKLLFLGDGYYLADQDGIHVFRKKGNIFELIGSDGIFTSYQIAHPGTPCIKMVQTVDRSQKANLEIVT